MSTGIAKRETPPSQQASAMILASRDRFAAALGKQMTVDQLAATVALTVARTPGLAECSTASVVLAAFTGATLGLSPDPIRGEFYLVPFKKAATPIIGYKGLIKLARRGGLERIMASEVCAGDEFEEILGASPDLKHRKKEPRGEVIGYYAICWLKDNPYPTWSYLPAEEVDGIRRRAPSGNSPAWKDSPGEMGKKTAARRLLKMIQLDLPDQSMVAMEVEDTEAGADEMKRVFAADLPALEEAEPEPETATDAAPAATAPPPPPPPPRKTKAPPPPPVAAEPAPLLSGAAIIGPLTAGLTTETVLDFIKDWSPPGAPSTATSLDQVLQAHLEIVQRDPADWKAKLNAWLTP